MYNPGRASSIFSSIRQEAGQNALKLARSLEKTTYKLEAHHRHLHFTHQSIENRWLPKSLRFKPPGSHPIFKRIMERTSTHCMRARVHICHEQINSTNTTITEIQRSLKQLISDDTFTSLTNFLCHRARSVQESIKTRHQKKLLNLNKENENPITIDRTKWVINLSTKPLSPTERAILEKGPKFAPTPRQIPFKDIVAEVEAAIIHLPESTKHSVRTTTASILDRSSLPQHRNITKDETKALRNLKKDNTRVIMKADKGNCFVVMDRTEYDEKMETILSDKDTYEVISKPPFLKIERQLNAHLLRLNRQQKLDKFTYRKLRSTDAIPPAIRGSVKHHKPNNPLRPIVSCIDSALYNTSQFLSDILKPLQNSNNYSVTNSSHFINKIADTTINDDETMVSFDVVSLFTAIPVEKACERIRTKLETDNTLQSRTKLTIDDIILLLRFTLSNSYFKHNDITYRQIHGCAMGSPVSPIVANLYMEEIEEQAINLTQTPPKTWERYVDDVFAILKKVAVSTFHDQLNSIDPHISFTIEHEHNRQIAFLDTLISHNNGTITTTVYRKPTHTDRYLHFDSHHDKKHKISTAATLLHRATKLPNTEGGKADEIQHVTEALQSNGYPTKFISAVNKRMTRPKKEVTLSPEELVGQFFNLVEPMCNNYAVLPYIKGLTEPLTRVLRKHDIKVFNKPLKTLQQEFPSPKDRPTSEKQTNVVYKIDCKDCSWCYIGETGRSFDTRRKEHIRNVKYHTSGSNIANHAWSYDHVINFEEGKVVDKAKYRIRKTLESWHTATTNQADNNSKPLPEQYTILIH